MAVFLLDTNHVGHAIRKGSSLRERIREAHRQGNRFATCWPVLCEVEAGLRHMAKAEAYRRTLHALLKEVRIWPTDWDTVSLYGDLFDKMKKKGRVLSHVDLV